MKTLYLGAMKSSGSAEWRDGGAYKALTALRKGVTGSYVIRFLTTHRCVLFKFLRRCQLKQSRNLQDLFQRNLSAGDQKLKE